MSDQRDSTRLLPNDHPLRETALVALSTEERETLIRAADLVDTAMHEFTQGDGPDHSERIAVALHRDLSYLSDAARYELEDWGGTSPLRRALVEALDGMEAAHSALSAVLEGGPE